MAAYLAATIDGRRSTENEAYNPIPIQQQQLRSLTPRGFAEAVYEANKDHILSCQGVDTMLSMPIISTQVELEV